MISTKEIFAKFENVNYFSRVDNTHILELHVGLDDKGRKAIELRSQFKPRKVTGTSAIEVNQYTRPDYNTIRFSLCDEEISGLFYKFCDDLIEQTRDTPEKSEGYTAIITRFVQWKKLFVPSKNEFLTISEIMGLIGEILVLKDYIAPQIGLTQALESWSGQELTHKDFSYADTWVESKAINRGKQTIKISSLEQLDSQNIGELVVHRFEKMSPAYDGVSLNKIILETRNLFKTNEERDLFMSKVALQGYSYNNYYDQFVFEICDFKKFCVNEHFPKLTPKDVPEAIVKASYDLLLTDIESYEIK